MSHKLARAVGDHGEEIAANLASEWGWQVIERNWRCQWGEIDLIARDGLTLVIVEVKTRRSARFGAPVEAVTRAKLGRLRRLAWAYAREHEVQASLIRVDVVGIMLRPGAEPLVQHLRGVA
ncbi:YraN family protein [Ornithinimicrobium sp. Arc0846-15]|nr:YraN family protein [Ornithinimicrobium laminariae]